MTTRLNREIVSAQIQITNDVVASWKAQIIFTLNNLGIFRALEDEPKSVEELSTTLHIPEESLGRLMNAANAIGYSVKDGDKFFNPPFVQAITKEKADGYMGNWMQMYERWYQTFSRLPQAVREGRAVEDVNAVMDQDYHQIFINGMKDYASYRGRDILNHIDLTNVDTLIDIGCGPGIYVGMFCERYPRLKCTCYDVPEALALAREHLGGKGYLNRIEFKPGNYLTDSSFDESKYDVVFISHVLHQEDERTCLEILRKSFNALKNGGMIIVQAMYLNDSKTGPAYASFHDLLSLMVFPGGKNYTYQETMNLLASSGFSNLRRKRMSLFNVNSLVLGEKGEA